jgi:hypothetical protein
VVPEVLAQVSAVSLCPPGEEGFEAFDLEVGRWQIVAVTLQNKSSASAVTTHGMSTHSAIRASAIYNEVVVIIFNRSDGNGIVITYACPPLVVDVVASHGCDSL